MTEEDPNQPKKQKQKPENLVIPPPKPKLSKAERRALQEQQRAAKAGGPAPPKSGGGGGARLPHQQPQSQKQPPPGTKPASTRLDAKPGPPEASTTTTTTATPRQPTTTTTTTSTHSIAMVSHLAPYQDPTRLFITAATLTHVVSTSTTAGSHHHHHELLHPAVLETGYQYATGQIRGANARCRAMLQTFCIVLNDYTPPSHHHHPNDNSVVDLRQAVDSQVLKPAFTYWTEHCRPHSVSMGNAFSFLKTAVASLDRQLNLDEMKQILYETMIMYVQERIDLADQVIAELACQKLLRPKNDDHHPPTGTQQQRQQQQPQVLLIYGDSQVITAVLLHAKKVQFDFRVILVDSRPLLEGRHQLTRLTQAGIECSYVWLNALTYCMPHVTKVLLGAAALLSDGSVMGRIGTAVVAMTAHAHHIPVLVCSETYKISNRVQLESITHNELGNPDCIRQINNRNNNTSSNNNNNNTSSNNNPTKPPWNVLNLLYDLTPPAFVSGIVTELGLVPPTSVAVLLREMNPQDSGV